MVSHGSCFMVTWNIFQKPPLGGRPNTNPRDHDTLNAHNRWFILFYHVWDTCMNRKFIEIAFGWGPSHIWLHTTLEDPWAHYMILEVTWDSLWTFSFGLSQLHDHGSWLMCEVALSVSHKDSKLVYSRSVEMNQQQTYGDFNLLFIFYFYFYVGWMRAMVGENRRLVHYQPMDFPSWPIQISNHRMAIRL